MTVKGFTSYACYLLLILGVLVFATSGCGGGGGGGGASGGGSYGSGGSVTEVSTPSTPSTPSAPSTTSTTTTETEGTIEGLTSLSFQNNTATFTVPSLASTGRVGLIIFTTAAGTEKNAFSYSALLTSGKSGGGPAVQDYPLLTRGDRVLCTTPQLPHPRLSGRQDISGFAAQPRTPKGSETFHIGSSTSVAASPRKEGAYCTLYVQDSEWGSGRMTDEVMTEMQQFFDNSLPAMRKLFGEEQPVGVNGDSRMTILFNSSASQFYSGDMFSRSSCPDSNERKIIYISSSGSLRILKTIIIHELQHAIGQYQKYSRTGSFEESWLTETLSIAACDLMGVPDGWTDTFLPQPYDSLTAWDGAEIDYAVCGMFGKYLIRQYSANVCNAIVNNAVTGTAAVTQGLKTAGYSDNFTTVYKKWAAANYCNEYQGSTPFLGYPSVIYTYSGGTSLLSAVDLAADPLRTLLKRSVSSYPVSETNNDYPCQSAIGPWSALYYEFTGGDGSDLVVTLKKTDGAALKGFYMVK